MSAVFARSAVSIRPPTPSSQFRGPPYFADRRQAGEVLADHVRRHLLTENVLVLGIPRGGVAVAAAVAERLGAELDVVVARKVGAPGRPELAVGAVTADGVYAIGDSAFMWRPLPAGYLADAVGREKAAAHHLESLLRGRRPPPVVIGRTVLVVDDGLATGATSRAVLRSLRKRHPDRLIAASPVGAREALAGLARDADEVVCPFALDHFIAVSMYYESFPPVTNEDVQHLLGHLLAA